jgi:hypothetical protein
MVVISRAQLRTSHDTVLGFLREAHCAIGCVRVRLCDVSGVAVDEKICMNDSADVAALAEEVAHPYRQQRGRPVRPGGDDQRVG